MVEANLLQAEDLRPFGQSRLTKLGEASGPLAQACAQDVQTSINKLLYFV
jgi:hypothetical protein